jgi:hypothetical protein
MTQPNYVVPPNPERAEWLRQLQIPENFPLWAAFRDHELNTSENGLTQAQASTHLGNTVDKLVGAQLETIVVLLNFQNALKQAGEGVQALFYKKKEAAPTNGATTDQ